MSFSEKSSLKDERVPLLREPVWHNSHRYGRSGRNLEQDEIEELLGVGFQRTQRFQWILFIGVTIISIVILLATLGILIRLSQTHPIPKVNETTTTPIPRVDNIIVSTSQKPSTTPSVIVFPSANVESGTASGTPSTSSSPPPSTSNAPAR